MQGAAVFAVTFTANVVTAADPSQVQRGRYLVTIGGCNDCHTEGFMEQALKIPEKDWLKGSAVGFQGMTRDDLKAIYAFVKSLGAPGVAAPAYVAPGGQVSTPCFVFVSQVDGKAASNLR
jgi:mono/diheme cytochrome c family protein